MPIIWRFLRAFGLVLASAWLGSTAMVMIRAVWLGAAGEAPVSDTRGLLFACIAPLYIGVSLFAGALKLRPPRPRPERGSQAR